jgi:PKD repeat protein
MRFVWRLEDGFSSTDTNIVHSFAKHGDFKMQLWVSSQYDCVDSFNATVLVHPEPTALFSVNDASQCVKGNRFLFNNLSSIDSTVMSYTWMFDDGDSSKLMSPMHQYQLFGNYRVGVMAKSIYNCRDSFMKLMVVSPMPTAAFTVNDSDQCINAQSFNFNNASSIQAGTLNQHLWLLNGQVLALWNVNNYKFNQIGLLPIRLIETSDSLCSDTAYSNVTIYPKPKADFSINDTAQL